MSASTEQEITTRASDPAELVESTGTSEFARLNKGYWVERVAGYVFFIGIWQFFSAVVVEDFILPPPTVVVQEMWRLLLEGAVWEHGVESFTTIFVSFGIALVIGTGVGILMGLSNWWDGFFRDGLLVAFTTPGLIFVLVSLMIFGIGVIGPIVAVVACSIPYVAINVWEGVKAVPKDVMSMATAFNLSRATRIRHIVVPAVAPYLFQGMRFGFSVAWKIVMLTEIFGGNSGIGFNIRLEFQLFQMGTLLAWVLWFFVAAIILERLVLQRLVDHSLRWRPNTAR